jgi:hypothetical protein
MGYRDVVTCREDVPVSDTQAYRQFGNSVVPEVVTAVGQEIVKVMNQHLGRQDNFCLLNRRGAGRRRKKTSA